MIEKITNEDREKQEFELLDNVIDKLNEIIDWINNQQRFVYDNKY